ncbi:MAG: hypothetical protein A3K83_06105 [Omnitrophica WOR_2 bacterium RBG_13_44_8b]|nr:MAG: hypothetical protein A3K83_06105 [Omnitrophica WOR_2 bacterium RBG_13_44_8b]
MTAIIAYIQKFSFKLVNFIFGKTTLFVVIIGWYLVISGLLFLVKPDKARGKLVGSGFGIAKLNILLICFFLWGVLAKWSQSLSGTVQTVVSLGGLAGLIILFFWARAAAKKKLTAFAERIPVKVLTWFAWGQVVVGGFMVYLQRRLW